MLVVSAVLAIMASKKKKTFKLVKLPLFLIMATALIGTTLVLFVSTVYLNMKAESKGPVHWHTDIEFWACGTELELRDPTGWLSNKIGTATYHEHNDKRMHLEGVVVKKSVDASFEKFMRVTGGYVNATSIGIPLNDDPEKWTAYEDHQDGDVQRTDTFRQLERFIVDGEDGKVIELKNGQACTGGAAVLQGFLYRYNKDDDTYSQVKLADPARYVMRDESIVPPGDCLIIEFDVPRDTTDKLCQQYGVRDVERCVQFGVKEFNPDLCNIKEVPPSGGTD